MAFFMRHTNWRNRSSSARLVVLWEPRRDRRPPGGVPEILSARVGLLSPLRSAAMSVATSPNVNGVLEARGDVKPLNVEGRLGTRLGNVGRLVLGWPWEQRLARAAL